ncbi:MAG: AAA family ATPase [Oscillospiraceae bacterium]|nr:AAA family ATPase [Oscillospiraceae bacterium]
MKACMRNSDGSAAGGGKLGKIITVTSGKGGTGKTTSTAAISSCLAALGRRTLCIDCDVGLRNLDIALGMTDYSVSDFTDVLSGATPLEEACHEHPKIPGLFFLSAPVFLDVSDIEAGAMDELCKSAREKFDFCLIDSPAGVGEGFSLAARNADIVVVVATGDHMSMRGAHRAASILADSGAGEIRLLVNRVSARRFRRLRSTVDNVIDAVGAQLIGIVAEDETVVMAGATGTPLVLYRDGRASRQFLSIARRLTGENVPLGRFL